MRVLGAVVRNLEESKAMRSLHTGKFPSYQNVVALAGSWFDLFRGN